MSQYNSQTLRFALDTAETFGKKVQAQGNIVQVVRASSAAAQIEINATGTNLQGSGYLPFKERDKLSVPDPFNMLTLTWAAQSGEWVELLVVTIDPAPERFEFTQEQRGTIDEISEPVEIAKGSTIRVSKAAPGSVASKILDADPTRKSVTIFNYSTTQDAGIGPDNTITLLNGFRLTVGNALTLSHSPKGELWAIGFSPCDLRIIEELG